MTNALSSIMWHWIEVGQHLPGKSDMYGQLDRCFSVMSIASYSMQWLPIPVRKVEPDTFWKRNFMGKPRETAEWRCRFTISLFVNMIVSIGAGYMVYKDDSTASFAGIGTIAVALCLSVYHLCIGEMSVGKNIDLSLHFGRLLVVLLELRHSCTRQEKLT